MDFRYVHSCWNALILCCQYKTLCFSFQTRAAMAFVGRCLIYIPIVSPSCYFSCSGFSLQVFSYLLRKLLLLSVLIYCAAFVIFGSFSASATWSCNSNFLLSFAGQLLLVYSTLFWSPLSSLHVVLHLLYLFLNICYFLLGQILWTSTFIQFHITC